MFKIIISIFLFPICLNSYASSIQKFTNKIFDEYESFLLSEDEISALEGTKYLYCSNMASILGKEVQAERYYKIGMRQLDNYTQQSSLSNAKNIQSHDIYLLVALRLNLEQYWFLDNKDILKGMIFQAISQEVNIHYIRYPNANKSEYEYLKLYNKHCEFSYQ